MHHCQISDGIDVYRSIAADVVAIRNGALFGDSISNTIFLDDVICSGDESSLLLCPHNGIGEHDCTLSETAGVLCDGNSVSDADLV